MSATDDRRAEAAVARAAPRAEFERRMHRVLAHIDAHLDTALALATLAEVAHFSPFHFHRLFAARMGETLGDYLRRRRVEVGAQRLITQPGSTVLAIALTVGFGSGEAFARAFKHRFGCSASQWREQHLRKPGQGHGKQDQDAIAGLDHDLPVFQPDLEIVMNVSVIDRPEVRIAYMRHTGPYGASVGTFWQQRVHPFLARHGLHGRPMYGIGHDDPLITAPEKQRYDAGVEVDPGFVAGDGAFVGAVPGGRYASVPFEGNSDTIGAAWVSLMRDWLPGSGYQLDARPCFEYYPPDACYDTSTGTFTCHLLLPLATL